MGKNKRIRKDKNVFKVTTRSIKLKAKAQKKVTTNLKKLDPKGSKTSSKNKTIDVNQLRESLLRELNKDLQVSYFKKKFNTKQTDKKSIKTNKKILIPTMTSTQTDTTISMMEQIQL